ncbi:hypothetical protein KEM52_000945 [Ascosphaera acerosa]|nr:hypothetical protein KEM52_000945 [Ascosphaera acerosa]
MFQAVGAMWAHAQSADDFLPYIDASLRLFGKLHAMATADGSNDDLADAWVQATWQCSHSVIRLLTDIGPSLGQGQGQPGSIVAGLLARTALMVQVAEVKDVTPLLSALASSNKSVQTAALDILRQALPQTMEDLCLGVALGEKEVGLPDKLADLLSQTPPLVILIGAPTANDVFWPPIRAYFLAWSYLFESLALASIPVRDKYAQIIKQHGFLEGLLDYIYEMLQTPTGKLVDASKFDIRHFEVNQSASEERELQWFAIHLYYLCLRYLPSLTTAWWSDSKNRVKGPVEAWTENHFSPLIIEDALHGVQEWYTDQDWSEDDLVMEVKISLNVKEIVASIAVDEDSPPSSIAITMPAGYPLHLPAVEGRTRIAVNDKTWQSWLRTIAGAIKFQGSLIDALIIYRRNTQGALKGQTECAICYSIVSPSMKLPNKRCATCKNTFHSDCLFRWFTSSNASSCPLCRNNFIYS